MPRRRNRPGRAGLPLPAQVGEAPPPTPGGHRPCLPAVGDPARDTALRSMRARVELALGTSAPGTGPVVSRLRAYAQRVPTRELTELSGEFGAMLGDILRTHARLWCTSGGALRLVICISSPKRDDGLGYEKVIYDDAAKASAAARELRLLGLGVFEVYECPRSRHGHTHLATARPRPGNKRRRTVVR